VRQKEGDGKFSNKKLQAVRKAVKRKATQSGTVSSQFTVGIPNYTSRYQSISQIPIPPTLAENKQKQISKHNHKTASPSFPYRCYQIIQRP
jgi:hypothetical protein